MVAFFCIMEKTRYIAIFDFDGTITHKDTFVEFIAYVFGRTKMAMGFLQYAPLLVLMKLNLYPNGKTKERIFRHFFKGMEYKTFTRHCNAFAEKISCFTRENVMDIIRQQQARGTTTYVISASVEEWVKPFCTKIGIDKVIATEIEIDITERLTGRFRTSNCFGKEKLRRFIDLEPNREEYYLYAYGDSRGDYDIVRFADEGLIINK